MDKRKQPRSQEVKDKIKKGLEEARLGLRDPPPESARRISLISGLRRYGLSLEDYNFMLSLQNNRCAICKNEETSISRYGTPKRLTVDHCHTTGKIRGLLCDNCNRGIGHMKDDIQVLKQAIEYLSK